MSVDVDDDIDLKSIDIDDFITKFEEWYKEGGETINPYDATEQFIDYYANKQLYLPFARRKLYILYILNISFISTLGLTLASFIMIVIGQLSNNVLVIIVFVTATFISSIMYIIAKCILYVLSKRESDISVSVINYKNILTYVIYPEGKLADFINSITKQRPTDEQNI